MNTTQAFRAVGLGIKVKRTCWDNSDYLSAVGPVYYEITVKEPGWSVVCEFKCKNIKQTDDWEIIRE